MIINRFLYYYYRIQIRSFKKGCKFFGFFDVVKLGICTGQKEEEDFCTVVYDFSNQLSKLLYQLYDEISSDNKKDESAYKKEAYNHKR